MKSLIYLFALFSLSSFAGDTYLLCHDRAENELVNTYVEASSITAGSLILDTDYIFDYQFNAQDGMLTAVLYDMHGSGIREYQQTELDYHIEVPIFRGIVCFLAD